MRPYPDRPYVTDGWCCTGRSEDGWFCTLAADHAGNHSAGGVRLGDGTCHVFREWPQDAPPASVAVLLSGRGIEVTIGGQRHIVTEWPAEWLRTSAARMLAVADELEPLVPVITEGCAS